MKLNQKLLVSSLAFLMASGSQAFAAGYSSELTSTSGLANSYAGSATGIHDVSDMFFNPATLSDVKDGEFILSVSYINLSINPKGGSAADGSSSGTETHDAGVNSTVPALYAAKRINDDVVFGLAVTSPFGLATKYDSGWQGKDRAVESSISTININPSLSYKVDEKLSLGAGFQAQYYQATLTNMAYTGSYVPAKMHGSNWGYGYILGAKYKLNDQLKLGLGYRSKVGHTITGTTQVMNYGYSDTQAKTATPESLTAGAAYQLSKAVELAYDVTWTRWSRLKSMTATATQNTALNNTITFNWHDSFLHSVGANFTLNDKWLLRTGVAYEKEAMTDSSRNPQVPASDKIWTSIGFNYKFTNTFSMDATYMHQFYRHAVTNAATTSTQSSLNVHYKTSVDVLSIALRKEF